MRYAQYITALLTVLLLLIVGRSIATEEPFPQVDILSVSDFSDLARLAENQQKLIMLEVSASYCGYCTQMEEELIKPMLRSGDYDDVLIRKVEIDSYKSLRDFDGNTISGPNLARRLDIMVTPTLIFLNGRNQEVSQRIIGVNSLDFLGAYVDDAIEQGLSLIR